MRFAKECWPFVLPFLGLVPLLALAGRPQWAVASGVLALAMLLFFRIPSRARAHLTDGVLSPASGKVLKLETLEDPDLGPGIHHRIVIFLSVFNIHVQRAPVGGSVVKSRYTPGRKLAAFDPLAGEVNEQHLTVLQLANGDRVGIRQIAGLLARRVVTYLDKGQEVTKGELMGVIKFGSRVDLLLPVSYVLQVEIGQRLTEGETVVARTETKTK